MSCGAKLILAHFFDGSDVLQIFNILGENMEVFLGG